MPSRIHRILKIVLWILVALLFIFLFAKSVSVMDYVVSTLLSYLLIYKYITVFVTILLSSFLLPLPSNTLFMAAGSFASQGYFNIGTLFIVGLIANVIGDVSGFAVTRIWGTKYITQEYLQRFSILRKTEDFIESHAKMTVFLTRFTGTPGVVVNFLSGLSRVSFRTFLTVDIIGNIFNILFFIWLGYFLKIYSESYSDVLQVVGWIVIILIVVYLFYKFFLQNETGK